MPGSGSPYQFPFMEVVIPVHVERTWSIFLLLFSLNPPPSFHILEKISNKLNSEFILSIPLDRTQGGTLLVFFPAFILKTGPILITVLRSGHGPGCMRSRAFFFQFELSNQVLQYLCLTRKLLTGSRAFLSGS